MRIVETRDFQKIIKKLHKNQKIELNKAVKRLMDNPSIGETKKGDLEWLRVYKFKMINQEVLLGYTYDTIMLTLITLGSHENFYRDVKNKYS